LIKAPSEVKEHLTTITALLNEIASTELSRFRINTPPPNEYIDFLYGPDNYLAQLRRTIEREKEKFNSEINALKEKLKELIKFHNRRVIDQLELQYTRA
jgi:hypothetical protein